MLSYLLGSLTAAFYLMRKLEVRLLPPLVTVSGVRQASFRFFLMLADVLVSPTTTLPSTFHR